MTAATFYFVPPASRELRVGTARVDHWFKRAPLPQSADLQTTAESGTSRIDHWFRDQARSGQWSVQNAGSMTASPEQQAPQLSGVQAWWKALRERMALARAEADLRALAIQDPRVLRDLEVARDLAEWKRHD